MNELLAIALVVIVALVLRVIVQAVLERLSIHPEKKEDVSRGLLDILEKVRRRDEPSDPSESLPPSPMSSPQPEDAARQGDKSE